MRRLGLGLCLVMATWLAYGCETQKAGTMELVFSWPDDAPDLSSSTLYMRGELQVWPDGVDEAGNPVTVTQRFTGHAQGDVSQKWVTLGGPESLTFEGLNYDIDLGVVIQVYAPNSEGGPDPPGDLYYYGRSEPFVLSAGTHKVVEVALAIQTAPGVTIEAEQPPLSPDEGTRGEAQATPQLTTSNIIHLCDASSNAAEDPATLCDDQVVKSPKVTLYIDAPSATRVLIANDAAFSVGLKELELATMTPITGELYAYPEPWDLNTGLPEGTGDGLRSVYVRLENALGLQGKAQSRSVILDTTPPSLSVVISPEQSAYAPGDTVEFLISASEALSSEPQVIIEGSTLTLTKNANDAYPLTLPSDMGEGSLALNVVASDIAGNEANWSRNITLDPHPPTLKSESVALSGTSDALCAFKQVYEESSCVFGDYGWTLIPGESLGLSYTLQEANPLMDSASGLPIAPTLRVGAFVAPEESCEATLSDGDVAVSCAFEIPADALSSEGNQDLVVSLGLRDAAQNASEVVVDTIRFSPQPPTSFSILTPPEPHYTLESCEPAITLQVPEAIIHTIELVLDEGSGITCTQSDQGLSPHERTLACTCTPEVLRGSHPISAQVSDFLGRSWELDLGLSVTVDPEAPSLTGPAELVSFTSEIAQPIPPSLGTQSQVLLLTEGTALSLNVPLAEEVNTAPLPLEPAYDALIDPLSSQVTLGGYPLAYEEGAWTLMVSQAIHGGAEGPIHSLGGVLKDLAGNSLVLDGALASPVPQVRFDFTPPSLSLPQPFERLSDGMGAIIELIATSVDTFSLEASAWPCLSDGGAQGCFVKSDPLNWHTLADTPEPVGQGNALGVEAGADGASGPSGQWSLSIDPIALPEGRYGIATRLQDSAGLTSQSCAGPMDPEACWVGVIEVDLEPPQVSQVSINPLGEQPGLNHMSAGDALTFSATLSDTMASRAGANALSFELMMQGDAIFSSGAANCEDPSEHICCQALWAEDEHSVQLTCTVTITAGMPSTTYSIQLDAQDSVHAPVSMSIGQFKVDNTPPELTLASFEPPFGSLAKAGSELKVSLSFDEAVMIQAPSELIAVHESDPEATIALVRIEGDNPAAAHIWRGAVPEGHQSVRSGTYLINPMAKDLAQNAFSSEPIPAFIVDTYFPEVTSASLQIERAEDACSAFLTVDEDQAGIGDTIAITLKAGDGAEGDGTEDFKSWSPETSHVDLDGVPLAYDPALDAWTLQVSAIEHANLSGYRSLSGVIRDEAGNERLIEALTIELPQVAIDGGPPEMTLSTFSPETFEGTPASANAWVEVSLSYSEPVRIESMIDPMGTGFLALSHSTSGALLDLMAQHDPLTFASAHQWAGKILASYPSGTYTINPVACDAAGNAHFLDKGIEAFQADTEAPLLIEARLSVEHTPLLVGDLEPQAGYAGVGALIRVQIEVGSGSDLNWDPETSEVALQGLPLSLDPISEGKSGTPESSATRSWSLTLDPDLHTNYGGQRTLTGVLRDAAGNETPLVDPEDGSEWPSIILDLRDPDLAVVPKLDRCDDFAPAAEADNRLHVKGDWDMALDCPADWAQESCSDPDNGPSPIAAPVRMTFVLDEPVLIASAQVEIQREEGSEEAAIDWCQSNANKIVAYYTPTGAMGCLENSCCDGVCGEGENCKNCPTDCGECGEVGCGDALCERYPFSETTNILVPYSMIADDEGEDDEGEGSGSDSHHEGDILTWSFPKNWGDGLYGPPGSLKSATVRIYELDGMLAFDETLSVNETVDQTLSTPGSFTMVAQLSGDGFSLTFTLPITVEAAIGSEDCDTCPDDCGFCGCVAQCAGKTCGGDGCGGSCGACATGQSCIDQVCVAEAWTSEDTVTLTISDLAGNRSALTNAVLIRDLAAPLPPTTTLEGQVTHERYPWGTAEHSAEHTQIVGLEGSAEPGAMVHIYNAETLTQAQRMNQNSFGGDLVDEEGGFLVELIPGDAKALFMVIQDRAGNRHDADTEATGVQALPILDQTWTATLKGKVAGSLIENPHGFIETEVFSDQLEQGFGKSSPEAALLGGDGQNNNARLETEGASTWKRHTAVQLDTSGIVGHHIIYDPARGVILRFGGLVLATADEPAAYLEGTWAYDGVSFRALSDGASSPPPRVGHTMVFDTRRGVVVLFGGEGVSLIDGKTVRYDDLWEWDGSTWTERELTGAPRPQARRDHVMAYDSARGVSLLFGGEVPSLQEGVEGTALRDTWSYDGRSWTRLDPDPIALCASSGGTWDACAFVDTCCDAVTCESQALNDPSCCGVELPPACTEGCQCADGAIWDETIGCKASSECGLSGGALPPYDTYQVMAYDPLLEVTLMGGGDNNELWQHDGERWTKLSPEGQSPSSLQNLFYDANQGVLRSLSTDSFSNLSHWQWTGEGWSSEFDLLADTPPSLSQSRIAFDSSKDVLIVHSMSDLYAWKEGVLKTLTDQPSGPLEVLLAEAEADEVEVSSATLSGHAMGWDPQSESVVLSGGVFNGEDNTTFWLWTDDQWTYTSGYTNELDTFTGNALVTTWAGAESALWMVTGMTNTPEEQGDDFDMMVAWSLELQSNGHYRWLPAFDMSNGVIRPKSRSHHAIAFEPVSGELLMHGGDTNNADTWTLGAVGFSGNDKLGAWEHYQASNFNLGVGKRQRHAIACSYGDVKSNNWMPTLGGNTCILFGGYCPKEGESGWGGMSLCEAEGVYTWGQSGLGQGIWMPLSLDPFAPESPSARSGHTLTFVPELDGFLMMRGDDQDDIWLLEQHTAALVTEFAWTELRQIGPRPSLRTSSGMTWDPNAKRAFLYGGESADWDPAMWEWNPGFGSRPGHIFEVRWPYAQVDPSAKLSSLEVVWVGEGTSYRETSNGCEDIPGFQISAWSEGRWKLLEAQSEASSGPVTWQSDDLKEIQKIFHGPDDNKSLHIAANPSGTRACGPRPASITSDYIEVTIGYRLPSN